MTIETTKGPNDLLAETVGDNEPSFNVHTHEDYWLPAPVRLQISTTIHYLTIAFEKNVNEIYEFVVDDTIVEYQPELIGIKKTHLHGGTTYNYTNFDDYVSVGIPTERYNWILAEAAKATELKIDNNSLKQSGGYTWITALIHSDPAVDCYIYLQETENLAFIGTLRDKVLALKSSLIGVGHFSRVAVLKTHDNKHILMFRLDKFQLKDKTEKSSKLKVISPVEPPTDIMTSLAISK